MITSEFAAGFTPEFVKYEVEHRRQRLAASYGRRAPRRPRDDHDEGRSRSAARWGRQLGRLIARLRGREPQAGRTATQVTLDVAHEHDRLPAQQATGRGALDDAPAATRPEVCVGAVR